MFIERTDSMIKAKTNNVIYYTRAIAIFCVICAHCSSIPEGASAFVVESSRFLGILGSLGVSCFLLLAGALFLPMKKSFMAKILSKVKKMGIPWLISGTIVYLYVALRKSLLSFTCWIKYLIGYESYLYYMTVLFLCFILFSFPFMRNQYVQLTSFVITIVSVTFFPNKEFLTPYLDIFNWFGYFALGMLIRNRVHVFEKTLLKLYNFRWFVYFVFILLQHKFGASYWGGIKPLISMIGVLCILLISISFGKRGINKCLIYIGKNSLFIYLWHMPLAGIVTRLFNYSVFVEFVLLRPFIILFSMFLIMKSLDIIDIKKLNLVIGYSNSSDIRNSYAEKK